jgi:hypothetical protein
VGFYWHNLSMALQGANSHTTDLCARLLTASYVFFSVFSSGLTQALICAVRLNRYLGVG